MASTSGISFSGIGTGMDITSLVTQLTAAERAPAQNRINRSTDRANATLSALGTISSAMATLQTSLNTLVNSANSPGQKATVGANAGFTATASTNAVPGNYNVEVNRLATAHKLTFGPVPAGTTVGAGTLHLTAGGTAYDIEIKDTDSLADVANAINAKSGGTGVSATVINANDGQHLVFNATQTGASGALAISASGDQLLQFINNHGPLVETTAAADASLMVDGLEVSSASNVLSDVIPGLTLNLNQAKPGEHFTVSIARDNTSLQSNLEAFITSYNATVKALASTSAYNAETNAASALTGDAMVRNMQSQLRNLVGSQVNELKALGVSIAKDGSLSLEPEKFNTALANDPALASTMFGSEGTLSAGMTTMLNTTLDSVDGTLTTRTSMLNHQLRALEDQNAALDLRMDRVYARYMAQFTAMDALVAQMSSTSSYLAQQFSNLSSS